MSGGVSVGMPIFGVLGLEWACDRAQGPQGFRAGGQ